jgi:hypothetical protein
MSGGTQSPPLEDHHPMGACSIRGGNVGGIPDRQQRSGTFCHLLTYLLPTKSYQKSLFPEYFDPSKQEQEQTEAQPKPAVTDTVRGQ